MAKLIYDHWFVQFDFPDAYGKPYKSSGGKMIWNETLKREIPAGWEVKQLPEIANYLFGNPFDSSLFNDKGHGFPIVRIRNVRDGFTADSTTESASDAFVIKNGDLLIGMDGYFDMNYWIGGDAFLVQRTCRVSAKDAIYKGFICESLRVPIKHYEKSLTGATLAHLGKAHLDQITLFVPPKSCSALGALNDCISERVARGIENIELARLRDWLLPMLMNGQCEVAE